MRRFRLISWILGMLGLSALASFLWGMTAVFVFWEIPNYYYSTLKGGKLPGFTEWLLWALNPETGEPVFWLFQAPWLTLAAFTTWQWPNIVREPWRFLGAWALALLLDLFLAGVITLALVMPWVHILTKPTVIDGKKNYYRLTDEGTPWIGSGLEWFCGLLALLAVAGLAMRLRQKFKRQNP